MFSPTPSGWRPQATCLAMHGQAAPSTRARLLGGPNPRTPRFSRGIPVPSFHIVRTNACYVLAAGGSMVHRTPGFALRRDHHLLVLPGIPVRVAVHYALHFLQRGRERIAWLIVNEDGPGSLAARRISEMHGYLAVEPIVTNPRRALVASHLC